MPEYIDGKDKLLLYELDKNSRQPYSALAKKLRMSQNAVKYRIDRLVGGGVIKLFQTVLDVGKLGFTSFRLYLKIKDATPKDERDLIDWLKQQPAVTWIVSIEGEYDLGMLVLTRTVAEMSSLWKLMFEKFINIIDERQLTIMTRVEYYSRAYLVDKKHNDSCISFITEPTTPDVDETDVALIKQLAPNARKSVVEIARVLGLTPKTVISRIRSLERRKVIIGYKMMIDRSLLGYEYAKILLRLHNITDEQKLSLLMYVKDHPNIIYNDEVLGGEDLELELEVKDMQHLRCIVNDLRERFGTIADCRIMRFYREHKYLYLPTF